MKVWEDEKLDILDRICAWEDGDTNRELTGMDWYRVSVDLVRDAFDVITKERSELDRVKAESLRMVSVGHETDAFDVRTFVRHVNIDGHVVRLERWDVTQRREGAKEEGKEA